LLSYYYSVNPGFEERIKKELNINVKLKNMMKQGSSKIMGAL
jgi:hypothetical protein